MWESRSLLEEQCCLYKNAAANMPQALCLTQGMAAVRCRAACWEDVGQAVSVLVHHQQDSRGSHKHLQDTLGACEHKLRAATAAGVTFAKAFDQ